MGFTPMPGISGMSLAEIDVPAMFIGRSCADLDLRNRFGVTLLLVKRQKINDSGISNTVPNAAYVFKSDDLLLLMGSPEVLIQLQDMI